MSTLALLLSLLGIVLNASKNIWCWATWILSDILWLFVVIPAGDIQQIILWIVFGLFNIYGWYQWAKKGTL